MRTRFFQLGKLVLGPKGEDFSRPWFIMETVLTPDGPRTRVCAGRWTTEVEAKEVLEQKEKEMRNV